MSAKASWPNIKNPLTPNWDYNYCRVNLIAVGGNPTATNECPINPNDAKSASVGG